MIALSLPIRFRTAFRALALGFWLLFAALPAWAQLCTTSAVSPVFGAYSSSGPGNNVTGSITVSCSVLGVIPLNIAYSIHVGLGGQAQGTQRRMAYGTDRLNYNIFCDSGRTQIWADGSNSTCVVTGGQNLLLGPLLTIFPVYGRLPGGQYVTPGAYSDSLQVQVLY